MNIEKKLEDFKADFAAFVAKVFPKLEEDADEDNLIDVLSEAIEREMQE